MIAAEGANEDSAACRRAMVVMYLVMFPERHPVPYLECQLLETGIQERSDGNEYE
jgi:hypothetical protein